MNLNLFNILADTASDENFFNNMIRSFFSSIIRFLYDWMAKLIDLMYKLASSDLGLGSFVENITEKIFVILIIFMVFKVTLSVMTYLINPDSFTDKGKGIQNVIKRILISLILLISINPIFNFLSDLQNAIIESEIITTMFLGSSGDSYSELDDGTEIYFTQISPACETLNPNLRIITMSEGKHLALLTLKPFIQPTSSSESGSYADRLSELESLNYCGVDKNDAKFVDAGANVEAEAKIAGPHSADAFMTSKFITGKKDDIYLIDFNYFFALIVGIIVFLILIGFCFDVVIRAFTLMILQVFAPIPIISYCSPGKSSEMLGIWGKKVIYTWLSLFIKMLSLSLAIFAISEISESDLIKSDNNLGLIGQIVLIIGILMFAKKLPQLLEELIPGLKMGGGFELNPLKRISKDALGGKQLLALSAAGGALGLAGATNFAHRTGSFIKNKGWQGEDGKFSLRKTAGGLGTIAGSTIAGQARAGLNAFGRTSKDGKLFAGAWGGYQTSMFSKLQREDNLRKAGLEDASLFEKSKFSVGSAISDAARYTGVLNKGQREYLNAARQDEIIKNMEERKAQEKSATLTPLQTYTNHAQRIKERIENSAKVKEAQTNLDNAMATGNLNAIDDARKALKKEKNAASKYLFENDNEVRDLEKRMNEIRHQNVKLQAEEFNFKKSDGSFDSNSISNTVSLAKTTELEIENKAIYNVEGYKNGDVSVVSKVNEVYNNNVDLGNYIENHNENSIAKLQNSQRMNKDIQQPGFKPSSGPVQQRAFDGYAGGHPGNGGAVGNPRGGGRPH